MTPEEKVAKTRSDLTAIVEVERLLKEQYQAALKTAARNRERDFKDYAAHRELLLETYKKMAHAVLCLRGQGRFHYFPQHHQETRVKIHYPDRYTAIPLGIEMEFDWEDRGYTETSTLMVSWEDIFAYEAGQREFS